MTKLRQVYILDSNGNPIEAISAAIPVAKVALCDSAGNLLKSADGALNIHDPHVHTEIVNHQFRQNGTTVATTIASAVTAGDTSITVASATGITVGMKLLIGDSPDERHVSTVTSVTGAPTIQLDFPLDNSYAIGEAVIDVLTSMNVTGTLAAPKSYKIAPLVTEIFHITSLQLAMTHGTAGDNGLFGNLTALTNSVVLRKYDGLTTTFETIAVWKSNGDIVVDGFEIAYASRSGGGGAYGTNAKWETANLSGAIIQLDGSNGDYLEILIQDDLSTLDDFIMHAQGHYGVTTI